MRVLTVYRDATIAHPQVALGAALLTFGLTAAMVLGALFTAQQPQAQQPQSEGDYLAERAQ